MQKPKVISISEREKGTGELAIKPTPVNFVRPNQLLIFHNQHPSVVQLDFEAKSGTGRSPLKKVGKKSLSPAKSLLAEIRGDVVPGERFIFEITVVGIRPTITGDLVIIDPTIKPPNDGLFGD